MENTENQDNQVESGEIEKEEIPHKSDDNEVSLQEKLDDITCQVQTLIEKGETEEKVQLRLRD